MRPDQEVREGRYREARALYEELYPELIYQPDPEIDNDNYQAAIDLASILSRTGEAERASWLLERSHEQLQSRPRLGRRGYAISHVQIYALRGSTEIHVVEPVYMSTGVVRALCDERAA